MSSGRMPRLVASACRAIGSTRMLRTGAGGASRVVTDRSGPAARGVSPVRSAWIDIPSLVEAAKQTAKTGATEQIDIADLGKRNPNLDVAEVKDELALASEACKPFELAAFREGHLTPVYFGNSLKVRLTCKQINPRENSTYGEVRWDCRVTNQRDEVVAQYDVLTMVAKTWPLPAAD